MRDIKFRAWDEQAKVMHYDFKFISSGDEGNDWIIFISDKRPLTDHKTNPFENPEPYFSQQFKKMQFTGLTDKNGADIYVGDICQFDNGDTFLVECEDWMELFCTWIGDVECEDQTRDIYRIEKASIIGNKFENSELLND